MRVFPMRIGALVLTVVCTGAGLRAQTVMQQFQDANNGVTVQYSGAWRPLRALVDEHYLRPRKQPVRLALVLDSGPQAYPGTEVAGLSFSYVVVPEHTAAGCDQALVGNHDAAPEGTVTINGRRFEVAGEQDAARNQEVVERLYSTFANDRCYLFALQMTKVGFGLYDSIKPVTQDEMDDAERRMESVLRTVRIENVH